MKKAIFAAIVIASMFAASCTSNEAAETTTVATTDSTATTTDSTHVDAHVVNGADTCGN